MTAPRPFTAEEVRAKLLDQVRSCVAYWESDSRTPSVREKLDGLAFSILNIIDGTSVGLPAFDLRLSPHPDDQKYHEEMGENWYESGQLVNDVMLHDAYYAPARSS